VEDADSDPDPASKNGSIFKLKENCVVLKILILYTVKKKFSFLSFTPRIWMRIRMETNVDPGSE